MTYLEELSAQLDACQREQVALQVGKEEFNRKADLLSKMLSAKNNANQPSSNRKLYLLAQS